MNPNDMELAVQLAALVESLERRSAQAVQQAQQASGGLQRTAQEAAQASRHITAEALDEFRRVASSAVTEGLRYPLADTDQSLKKSVGSIEATVQTLDAHMKTQRKVLAAYAWKTFIASVVASLVVIAVAVYMVMRANNEVARSEWVTQINAAIANGKLVACPEGGICAYIGKKAVRLDQ